MYIMTNFSNSVLYIGVTNNLTRRVQEHKDKILKGFTFRYKVTKLVYYECYNDVRLAIEREKQLKSGPRQRKIALIEKDNSGWCDLSDLF